MDKWVKEEDLTPRRSLIVKELDVTRDEIRTYTAGMVTVLNQQTSTRLENGAVVVRVNLTAQVDQDEAVAAINALRENESAARELVSLRGETEQLRQRLEEASQALAAARSAEQVHALTVQRQQLLNQMESDSLVAQALSGYAYLTPANVRQINELLNHARQLHPSNPHLASVGQSSHARPDAVSPAAQIPPGNQLGGPLLPESPLAAPLPPSPLATPLPQSPLAAPLPPSPLATPLPQSPLSKPLGPSPLAAPLAPSPLAAPLR